MSIDSASVRLDQYMMAANSPLITKVVNSLYQYGNVVQDWPLMTKSTLTAKGARWVGNLPTVGWRKINEATTVASGTPQQFSEQAYILSNAIDVDVKLIADQNQVSDPRGVQLDGYLASVTYDLNDKFINGNHVTGDADAFVGLRHRLDNPTTYGVASANKIDCGGVDLSNSGITAANGLLFLRYLDQALDLIGFPDGDGCVIYWNRGLNRRVNNAVKLAGSGGGFEMTKDAFDRRVTMYRNAVVRPIGVKSDQSTEIITATETSAGADGSSTFTSFYVVKYGEEYVQPWQMAPLNVQDIGQRSDEPTHYRIFVDWAVGYIQQNTHAIARGYDVKVA